MTADCEVKAYIDPAAGEATSQRALLLDRDGVINLDLGYVHTPAQTEFVDGIFELCGAAAELGYSTIVVTNQAGIARGLYTEAEFIDYTRWMHGEFVRRGAPLAATYYCPHHPTAGQGEYRKDCGCRKPAPGMIVAAERRYALDLAGSVLVGDKPWDMQAGRAAGVGTCLLYAPGAGDASGPTIGALREAIRFLEGPGRRG